MKRRGEFNMRKHFRSLVLAGTISILWVSSFSPAIATDQTWLKLLRFPGADKLKEYGTPGPDTIPIAIIGKVDKPGIYWIYKETLEVLLTRFPAKGTKGWSGYCSVDRRDGSFFGFRYGDAHDTTVSIGAKPGPEIPASEIMLQPYDIIDFRRILIL